MNKSRAEDSGKRTGRQLRILKKDRYGLAAKTANPQIIIKISDGDRADPAFIQEKVRYGC
jgi:hypothetical protein